MAMKKGEEYGALVVLIMVGVIGGAFGLVGGGLVLVGLGVFLVQCLGWLRYGLWVPVELWQAWAWLGWQWPIPVKWLGVQKIIIWIFEAPP